MFQRETEFLRQAAVRYEYKADHFYESGLLRLKRDSVDRAR
jgi:hypothetical protein